MLTRYLLLNVFFLSLLIHFNIRVFKNCIDGGRWALLWTTVLLCTSMCCYVCKLCFIIINFSKVFMVLRSRYKKLELELKMIFKYAVGMQNH